MFADKKVIVLEQRVAMLEQHLFSLVQDIEKMKNDKKQDSYFA